ncbi:J domain-containing protein [Nitrogeniibacter aestuarii]|uniref:J domain-containing protein n=1 Tax=Nitrogeniibacter aestuarii TaxID=2815343 RepID=UPI001D0FD65A|nr:J domain-containing protein [Nitrogeniibacter aestuarii]
MKDNPTDGAQALQSAPDPACDGLRLKIEDVQGKILDLSERKASMDATMTAFHTAQYEALGELLADCLALRCAVTRRQAEISGSVEDREAAAAAARETERYQQQLAEAPAAAAAQDPETRARLKQVYRAVAMRCHPDRVEAADQAQATEHFQRAQRAYRQSDLEALEILLAELEALPAALGNTHGQDDLATLERALSRLRGRAADLILEIQTLQLSPEYRRALDPDRWGPYFDEARQAFERERDQLRAMLRTFDDRA